MTARPTTRLYWIPVKPQDLGYLRAGREPDLSLPHSQSLEARFTEAIHALALSLGRRVKDQPRSNFLSKAEPLIAQEGAEVLHIIELRMAPADAEHLRTLWACMVRNGELCRREGFRNGRNILTGLMDGSLSTAEAQREDEDHS